jgi:hypothetical protein
MELNEIRGTANIDVTVILKLAKSGKSRIVRAAMGRDPGGGGEGRGAGEKDEGADVERIILAGNWGKTKIYFFWRGGGSREDGTELEEVLLGAGGRGR